MQNSPYQELAKQFMDLWQKQMASVMSDKQFIHAMLNAFQNMQAPASHDPSRSAAASHPADAADDGHGLLAELAFRVAMCEKRLAELEQRSREGAGAAPGAGPGGRGKKSRQ